jgi:hypothetical protein
MSSLRATLAVAVALAVLPGGRAAAQSTASRTFVMPFDAGGDPRAWWIGEGVAVALADALRGLGVDVIGRDERLSAFARLQVPPVASLTHGTVIRVGQIVGAQGVVFGTVALSDDALVVRARNLRLDTGRIGAEVEERGQLRDLFAIVERVAGRVAPLNVTPSSAKARPPSPPPQAFEHYMKGLLAETSATQVQLLEKALAIDPGFARARLALWRVYTDDGDHAKALESALAVKTDSPSAAAAQFAAALSEVALERYDAAFDRLKALGDASPLRTTSAWCRSAAARAKRRASPRGGSRRPRRPTPATPTTSSTSATPTGSSRICPPRSTGCARPCAGAPPTPTRTSCWGRR